MSKQYRITGSQINVKPAIVFTYRKVKALGLLDKKPFIVTRPASARDIHRISVKVSAVFHRIRKCVIVIPASIETEDIKRHLHEISEYLNSSHEGLIVNKSPTTRAKKAVFSDPEVRAYLIQFLFLLFRSVFLSSLIPLSSPLISESLLEISSMCS